MSLVDKVEMRCSYTWKSISRSFLLHLTRNAEQTYRWNWENASVPSAYAASILSALLRWLKSVRPYQVRIPHADSILHADLAHEQTIHPAKRELHELDILGLQMGR